MNKDFRWHTPADFAARIRLYSQEEGGRYTPAHNGLRWDFAYIRPSGKADTPVCMVWPLFCDAAGQPLPPGYPLPVGEWLHARLFAVWAGSRGTVHQPRIRPGVSFFCTEGPQPVAKGTVTEILALFAPRGLHWPDDRTPDAAGI